MSGWGGNTNALLASADLGAWIAVRLVISSVRVTGELIMAEGRQGANAQQGSCLSEWLLAIQSAQPALPHSHPKHLQTQPGPWCEVVFKLITWARWAFSFGEGPHTPSLYMVSHQARRAAVLPGPPAQRWLWVPAGQGHGSAHASPQLLPATPEERCGRESAQPHEEAVDAFPPITACQGRHRARPAGSSRWGR